LNTDYIGLTLLSGFAETLDTADCHNNGTPCLSYIHL